MIREPKNRAILPLLAMFAAIMGSWAGGAQAQSMPTPFDTASLFGDGIGDGFTSIFLNQIFGPLFPAIDGSTTETVFSRIIGYFNVIILVIGGLMFFWNITVGILQTAHEGEVLGRRWSSLWAPLRILFAVGLLVPVPGLGGYNLAQAGIAYVVKGSTNIASAIWRTSAEMVISGETPITVAPARIDAEVVRAVYMNAACAAVVNHQMQMAGGSNQVVFDTRTVPRYESSLFSLRQNQDTPENTFITSFLRTNRGDEMPNICGMIKLPDTPQYITTLQSQDSEIQGIPSAQYDAIKTRFDAGHRASMDQLRASMDEIVASINPQIMDSSAALPNITSQIASAKTGAESTLQAQMTMVINLAVGNGSSDPADRIAQGARDRLLARITGGNCEQNPEANGSAMRCYGEGWIGAGSLYIMMARLNSEIASLTTARSSADMGSYIRNVQAEDRNLNIRYGGGSWLTGVNRALLPHEEAELILSRYRQAFENSAAALPALGFSLSTDDLRAVSSQNPDIQSIFEGSDRLNSATHDMSVNLINYTSPDNWGADPMIGIMNVGEGLVLVGLGIIAASAGLSAIPFFGGVGEAIAIFLMPFVTVFLTAGGTLIYVLPLMPFIFWVLAVTGYFLLVIEAIIAINLWGLAHLRMDGEGISGEAGRRGWLMMLSLLMTPVLMIFGFLIGITIFRVSSALINIGFYQAAVGLYDANWFVKLIAFLVYGVMIVVFYIVLLERSFSLVSEFPNRVLRWMDSEANLDNGESGRARAVAAMGAGAVYQGAGGLGPLGQKAGSSARPLLTSLRRAREGKNAMGKGDEDGKGPTSAA